MEYTFAWEKKTGLTRRGLLTVTADSLDKAIDKAQKQLRFWYPDEEITFFDLVEKTSQP